MSLERDLKASLSGDVYFTAQAKALYATDASNYRQIPIGVVLPKNTDDILKAMEICRRHGVPLLSRGAGTSLAGQCCNTAVILDFSRHINRILEIDPTTRRAWVEPGVILDHLREQAQKYGLTFGPDPATHSRCTLGGMIGNNSCGVHAVAWGKTVDNVERLDVLTYEGLRLDVGATSEAELDSLIGQGGPRGTLFAKLKAIRDQYGPLIRERFPKIPRRVSGYNLDELLPEKGFHVARALTGTEGTCVTVLKAQVRLVEDMRARELLVLGFPSVYDAADAIPQILTYKPLGLEGFDYEMVDGLRRYQGYPSKIKQLPEGRAWLLVEFGGHTSHEALEKAKALAVATRGALSVLHCDASAATDIWRIRESALAATALIPGSGDRYEGWEDAAVAPERLGSYLRKLRALYQRYGFQGAFYGHFGDGCVHTRIDFDLDSEDGKQKFRRFVDEAADLVIEHGGSISGEHGDGQARGELLPKMFGPDLMRALEAFKDAWDPLNRMNPGKLVRPKAILEDLRYGLAFQPKPFETHFKYPDDQGLFGRAALRCVGVGQCRREDGGLMCPPYQVTRDEKHSTRGRAHLLFEMLKGETITSGWQSEEVKEALDHCLSCKGCKSECPTNVDMATYKAEFLSHYYEKHLRPREAYAFGWAPRWLRRGARIPQLANVLSRTPGISHLLKMLAGMSQKRQIPQLAEKSFDSWWKNHKTPSGTETVMIWPDTFMNYLEPQIGQKAVAVLEKLGFQVILPPAGLCCGRPLYDYGFLVEAKKQLAHTLDSLQDAIQKEIPILFLEPSCASVFRHELTNLFPNHRLSQKFRNQCFLLSEFLLQPTPYSRLAAHLPALSSAPTALLQSHCHEKSVLTAKSDYTLLTKMGYRVIEPESGCCGMAGAFGFEADHAALSCEIGERALLPAVREAAEESKIVASGFSCRQQIEQGTDRKANHLVEILEAVLGTKTYSQ